MAVSGEYLRAVAEEEGLLNGDPEHDQRVLDRLWWHFAVVSA